MAMRGLRCMRTQNRRGQCQADGSGSGSKLCAFTPTRVEQPPWHRFGNSKAMDARQLWARGSLRRLETILRQMIGFMPERS